MKRGDFVITPAWAFHDHGNKGKEPCAWLDGLDIHVVSFFETMFSEEYNDQSQTLIRPEGDALARFGEGLLPLAGGSRYWLTTPIFNYPYERTRHVLTTAGRAQDPDPHLAVTMRYANPLDGGWVMPTISAWITYLPKGFETKLIRSTDGMVMAVAEGRGTLKVGEQQFVFAPSDVHAIPCWMWRSFNAHEDCFLFFFSDRVAQEKLGLFREERKNHHV